MYLVSEVFKKLLAISYPFLQACISFLRHFRQECWEKVTGGFPKPGGSDFSGKVLIASQTLSAMFLADPSDRPRKGERMNRENPRKNRENQKKMGQSQRGQKDESGRTSPNREAAPFQALPSTGP